jgi:hypothetical protein
MFLLGSALSASSQDFHFSNNEAARCFLNNAVTPMVEDYQATLAYRQQYTSVPVGYITSGANFLAKVNSYTVGLSLLNDRAGDASYQTTRIQVPLIKHLSINNKLNIGAIISPAISMMSYNAAALTFNSQFSGDLFNASNPSGETFANQSARYFHSLFGLAAQYNLSSTVQSYAGYSFTFFASPKQYQISSISKNSNRHQVYARAVYAMRKNQVLSFELNVSVQKKYNQSLAYAQYQYYFTDGKLLQNAMLGLGFRTGDAVIAYAGLQMKDIQLNLAYDFTSSSFAKATNHQGATELIVVYRFFKKSMKVNAKPACPVFL